MPCQRIEVAGERIFITDFPGQFEEGINAFKRRLFHAVEIAELLGGDPRRELHLQFRRRFSVIIIGLPNLVTPAGDELAVNQSVIGR